MTNSRICFTIELGLLARGVAAEIKRTSLEWGFTCDHTQGPGWISANHTFNISGDSDRLKRYSKALKSYLRRVAE